MVKLFFKGKTTKQIALEEGRTFRAVMNIKFEALKKIRANPRVRGLLEWL